MDETDRSPTLGGLASAYCCAVVAASLTGVATVLALSERALPRLHALPVLVFLAAEAFPFLFVAALPFTVAATAFLLKRAWGGWLPFVLLGALCPATIIVLFFLLGPEFHWDFSVRPPRQVPAYDGQRLLAACMTFAPAGALAGWIYWLVGFARQPRKAQA